MHAHAGEPPEVVIGGVDDGVADKGDGRDLRDGDEAPAAGTGRGVSRPTRVVAARTGRDR